MDSASRYAADPAWSLDDAIQHGGHGTKMAGWALYGDLTNALAGSAAITIPCALESIKILPDASGNLPRLFGAMTRRGIETAEAQNPNRQRVYTMAVTTSDDYPHDGAPTSWSAEMDQLACGDENHKRLILVSAGNADANNFRDANYLPVSDAAENEIESPAQAWNIITVGGYTEKVTVPPAEGVPLAPFQDLSPLARTASWQTRWPIKPDIIMEAGNLRITASPPAYDHGALSLLTANHTYPNNVFDIGNGTSPATAFAAKELAQLWHDYPQLWPESLRALYISSARWTEQMNSHLPPNPNKTDYIPLFQRYGYGVPNMERAQRSASNALTLIAEDSIKPYIKNGSDIQLHQMKFFNLPWPEAALRALGTNLVTLRVALSTFIAPNVKEASWGTQYGYASHNLRFDLSRINESQADFRKRINKLERDDSYKNPNIPNDWKFGSDRRDVGSIQIDELTCPASDLAQRSLLAVYPISGWQKTSRNLFESMPDSVRFSLIIEIDAEEAQADLYTEMQAAMQNAIAANNKIELVSDSGVIAV